MTARAGIELKPWDRQESPSEQTIRAIYRQEGLSPISWSNGPGDRYGTHSHTYHKVLYCVRGSITFVVESSQVHMDAGDRLELPPGTNHSAVVGPRGCTCFEAHV